MLYIDIMSVKYDDEADAFADYQGGQGKRHG